MSEVSEQLNKEWELSQIRVHFVSNFYSSPGRPIVQDSLMAIGVPEEAFGRHAGIFDVSYSLGADPSLVRQELLKNVEASDNMFLTGYDGDPKLASQAIGKRLIKLRVQETVDQINQLKVENRK